MTKPIIAVVGGTGAQGGGVVDALLATTEFAVRVASRNPTNDAATRLRERGVDVVQANLLEHGSLSAAFDGAYGAFVVTNFWDPAQMENETTIGTAAVRAARASGVTHLVWSTLPDCAALSGGRFRVAHFTGKALVDPVVASAGFPRYTFVQPPLYFQNFLTRQVPTPLPNGRRGWAVPMDTAARVVHAGDVKDVGRAVAAAFAAGDRLQNGSYLAVAGGTYSWNDFAGTLTGQGHDIDAVRVPADVYDGFFPAAAELREMFQFYEEYTYFGPKAEERIARAKALCPDGFTSFADWAKVNWPA